MAFAAQIFKVRTLNCGASSLSGREIPVPAIPVPAFVSGSTRRRWTKAVRSAGIESAHDLLEFYHRQFWHKWVLLYAVGRKQVPRSCSAALAACCTDCLPNTAARSDTFRRRN
jgi:hypothetical protein